MKKLKRILSLFVIVLILGMSAGGPVHAAETAARTPGEILASMTAVEKAAQLVMPAFRWYTDEAGERQSMTELTADAAKILEEYGFAGVVLFSQNTADTEKAVQLVDAMQRANAGNKTQLLIAVDQEGGSVTRLGHGTQMPGNMALGAADDVSLTGRAAEIIGSEIMSMGINFDFAPVLDVNSNPANPVIGIRSFSDDPYIVANQGVEFMRALQSAGAISTLKHFPGHGDTAADSHTGLPLIDRSYEELQQRELIPFQAAIDAGADAIMTAHIQYPQIETATYTSKLTGEEIHLPATLSGKIITDILRGDMGFDGVVITDAMEMDAIAKHFDRYDAAKLAIEAGVDILLMPVDTSSSEGMDALRTYVETLADMVDSGRISPRAVDDAVLRILTLKEAHGLTEPYGGIDVSASAIVGSREHHEAEWEIAKQAVTLVKNENDLLPLTGENEAVTVLTAYDNEVLSMEYAVGRLREEGKLAAGMSVSVHSIQRSTEEEAVALTQGADHVVVITELYSAAGLTGAYSQKVDAILDSVHEAGGDVIVLSCSLPYDVARYQEADAIMIAWSAKGMSEDPRVTEGAVAQYGPNMPAALYMMLSPDGAVCDSLPVNIPALTEDRQYSDEILYPRGWGLRYSAPSAEPVEFRDVSEGAWYYRAVLWAAAQSPQIVKGTGADTFSPGAPCTRAQYVTMLWRWAGGVSDDYPAAGFTDVPEDAYYSKAVAWASCANVVDGTSKTTFSPDAPITRGQAVTMLQRLWSLFADTAVAAENPFSDVADGAYYGDAVLWAVEEGITKGTSQTTFSPDDICDRAAAVTFLYRLFGSFRYFNDPRENPGAMADIVLDRDAVYGFRPSETGSLKQYAGEDWTDPASVEEWRQSRIAYHESLRELYGMIEEMQDAGYSAEEIARAVSTRRNELRLEACADDPEALAKLKERNLEKYGHEEGPLPEELYEKYGSWTMVLAKALSTNSGMDACLGLYDTYYQLYVAVGQVEDHPD